jgi:DHA1 family bicyclomycin/chloramphenicol resistance-like MFS transporter
MQGHSASINRSRRQNFFLILILGALNVLTPFSIDMYLPAFPRIAKDLNTTISNVALTLSTYFFGFALGQIFYGPLLDRFGRKPPLFIGLFFYIIASVGCISFHSIEAMLFIRFAQAFSGCVASVAAMAMVRDFFPVDESSRIISLMILILGVSPMLAPSIGSFLVTAWGWHFVFVLLSLIALVMLLVVFWFLPEGHQADPSLSLKPKSILSGFKIILAEPKFYVFTLAGSLSFAGLFVYVTSSPAIFMNGFHLSAKTYSFIFAFLSVSFIGGSQLNHVLARKYQNEKIFKTTLIFQVLVSILFLLGELSSWDGLAAVLVFLFIFLFCTGLGFPNAAAVALSPFSKNAGAASALLGFIQIGIGGLISAGIGLIAIKGSLAAAMMMAISSSAGLAVLLAF